MIIWGPDPWYEVRVRNVLASQPGAQTSQAAFLRRKVGKMWPGPVWPVCAVCWKRGEVGGYKTPRWFQGRNKILYSRLLILDIRLYNDRHLSRFLMGHWCSGCLVARSPLVPSLCCVTWQKGRRGVKQLDLGSPFGMMFRCSDCPSPSWKDKSHKKIKFYVGFARYYVLRVLRNS